MRLDIQQAQAPAAIPQKLRDTYHPAAGTDLTKALNRTYHTAFYGEIVAAYIIFIRLISDEAPSPGKGL